VFPNPESVRMQLSGFWKDPEHVRFYHPELIGAVCGHYGLAMEHGPADEPPPHRLEPPWLAGAHLDGLRIADAATPDDAVEGTATAARADDVAAAAEAARGTGTVAGQVTAARATRWVNRRLDAISPRAQHYLELMAVMRAELGAALAEHDAATRALAAELHQTRVAVDRVVDLQDRMLAGLGALNVHIERFNGDLAASVEAFNRRLGPLMDAVNAMWGAADEAVLVCRKRDAAPGARR
jgi:hypothetical protein